MREPGFYWVREFTGWIIAHWSDHYCSGLCWAVPCGELTHDDDYFEEIDENRIPDHK
jgi:hypothetical protein